MIDLPGEVLAQTNERENKPDYPRKTLREVVNEFEWDKRYLKKKNFVPNVQNVCERTKDTLAINADELLQEMQTARSITSKIFGRFYPNDRDKNQLPYHDDIHANTTLIVGIQMFLGALEEMTQNPDYAEHFKKDPELATRLAKTAIYAYAMHEYKDWWTTGQDPETVKNWDEHISRILDKRGVNTNDVGIVQELDTFGKTLTESVAKTFQPDFRAGFVQDNNGGELSLLQGIEDNNFQVAVLNALGGCLRAADFSQTFNPSYLKKIILVDGQGIAISKEGSYMGPYVLADEFMRRRPNALDKHWAERDENKKVLRIRWENVGIAKEFYENFIKPSVMYGIEFMKRVNEDQYNGMKKAMEKIEANFL